MSSPKPYSAPLNFSCNLVYDQKPAKQMTSHHLQMHSLFKGTICKKWPPDKILFKQTNFTVYFTSCSVQSMVNIRIFLSILQYFDNFTPHVIQFLVMLIFPSSLKFDLVFSTSLGSSLLLFKPRGIWYLPIDINLTWLKANRSSKEKRRYWRCDWLMAEIVQN